MMESTRRPQIATQLVTYLALAIFVVVALFPFYWMALTSFRTARGVYVRERMLVPRDLTLENYKYVFTERPTLMWLRNSANEAKRMWLETFHVKDEVDYIAMDSKADDASLFREFKRQRKMNLITSCRANMGKTTPRKKMIAFMSKPKHRKIYRERAYKVEPMQGLVKDIFELDRCWMRGDANNRWLFAAMGLTIQMHQLQAFKQGRSTWNIKEQVLG